MIIEDAKIWALIPVKCFDRAKQRLADVLDATERAALAKAMLWDVLRAVSDVQELAGVSVATNDDTAARMAEGFGARILGDVDRGGMNTAVAGGIQHLRHEGANAVLVCPADIPLVRVDDFRACLEAYRDAPVVLAPAYRDGGTNMLLQDCAVDFEPAFGPNSFARHLAMARAARLAPAIVRRARIGLDIDEPADLAALLSEGEVCAAQEVLRRFAREGVQSLTARVEHSITSARCDERHIR